MLSSPPTEAPAAEFVCDCGELSRPACKGLPFYKVHKGKRYCVLHYPSKEKSDAFAEALKKKLDAEDFDFREVWFPTAVNFSNFTWTKPANVVRATFSEEADFFGATFSARVTFVYAMFSAMANFDKATFSGPTYFVAMTFSKEVSFRLAHFKDEVRFIAEEERKVFGDKSFLSLHYARVDHPDRFSFDTLRLRPHWFVNVDAREFEFIDVNWDWQRTTIRREMKFLDQVVVSSPYSLLSIACRNLAVNAEDNHRYEEASRFRYMAMDARRVEKWRGFALWRLGWWYWLASGYGERVLRAFVILIAVWWIFAFIFYRAECTNGSLLGKEVCVEWEKKEGAPSPRESFPRSLAYTLDVMTLQKPEPRPASPAAHMLVTLCTILGPVQGALLALAIRRKFMR